MGSTVRSDVKKPKMRPKFKALEKMLNLQESGNPILNTMTTYGQDAFRA